jgi:hypothetical protein
LSGIASLVPAFDNFGNIPASVQKRRHFDADTLAYAKRAIKSGQVIDVALLDYSRMKAGWASHDARHKARAMLE